MKKQSLFIVFIIVTALGAGIWREHFNKKHGIPNTILSLNVGTAFPEPRHLPEFTLEDHNGKPFTHDSFKNRWSLVFFGFTSCSNICPTTLTSLKEISQRLVRLPAMQYVFVTIDPEFDNQARLKQYLQQPAFGAKTFTGVTGEKETILSITQNLGIHIGEMGEDKNLEHSGTLFLVNPDGKLAAIFSESTKPHAIAHDVKEIVHYYAVNNA